MAVFALGGNGMAKSWARSRAGLGGVLFALGTAIAVMAPAGQSAVAAARTGAPSVIGILTTAGVADAKEGSLMAGWTRQYPKAAQIVVASDATNGPVIVVLTTTGVVYAKEGSLTAGWTKEYTGVAKIAVASDATNGPLIAVLTKAGVM